jgi:hypothetical protein
MQHNLCLNVKTGGPQCSALSLLHAQLVITAKPSDQNNTAEALMLCKRSIASHCMPLLLLGACCWVTHLTFGGKLAPDTHALRCVVFGAAL